MNNDFITTGIQKDRYLKATRLVERFETELKREIRNAGDEIVAENPHLFANGVEGDWNHHLYSTGPVLGFARFDYVMNRQNPKSGKSLKLNFAFRWVEPSKIGHDADGALSIVSYKIKNALDDDYRTVMEATRNEDWGVQVGNDPHDSYPASFYVPVRSLEEIRIGHEKIMQHFSEFGRIFGEELPE